MCQLSCDTGSAESERVEVQMWRWWWWWADDVVWWRWRVHFTL